MDRIESIIEQGSYRSANGMVPLKRITDIILSLIILFVFAIPLFFVMLAIKISSRGPVFFRQPRIGLHDQVFSIWKFRTMYHNDADIHGANLTVRNDPRLTPIGVMLRKFSIDEMPQFLNILTGDMSLVGPRPHPLLANVEGCLYGDLVPNYSLRHRVKPGITGWAQVNGWRGETNTPHQIEMRVRYDLEYVARQSFWFDLQIILMTPSTLTGKHVF